MAIDPSQLAPHIRDGRAPLQTMITRAISRFGEFNPATVDGDLDMMMLEFANLVIEEVRSHPYWDDSSDTLEYYISIHEARPIPDTILVAGLLAHLSMQQGSKKAEAYVASYHRTLNQTLWQRQNGNDRPQMTADGWTRQTRRPTLHDLIPGPPGPEGPPGTKGDPGARGKDGNQGPPGPNGPAGPQGPAGADGTDIELQFNATHFQFRKVGDVPWTDIAPLSEITGAPGADGADGADGATGAQGPTGATGPQGAQGIPGDDGADGVDGITWHSGSGAPSGGLGNDGDFYLDLVASAYYGPKSGSWGSATSLIGATGPTGDTGPAGADGADGANGTDGTDGATLSGINAQSGTSYTLVLTDASKMIEATNASAITLTVPPNSDVAFSVGDVVHVAQGGGGQVTIAPGSGVTLKIAAAGLLKTSQQDAVLSIAKVATDTWRVFGDVEAA